MDELEKQEKRMVNQAYFACAAVVVAGCMVLGLLVLLLAGFRFSADSAVSGTWRKASTLEAGNYTFYYTLTQGEQDCVEHFAAVKKSGPFYRRNSNSGRLVYPAGSDVPAGQLFSYEDGEQWHHVLLLNMVLPQGTDRQIETLVIRKEKVEVTLNSCFSTPLSFSEFILDGITFEVRDK